MHIKWPWRLGLANLSLALQTFVIGSLAFLLLALTLGVGISVLCDLAVLYESR